MRRVASALWPVLLLVGAVCLLCRESLTQAYVGDDFEMEYMPERAYIGRTVAAGKLPLYCPEAGAGSPMLAQTIAGVLYPGNLLFALRPAHPTWAMSQTILWHLVWGGLGVYALLRLLAGGPLAALAGGVLFAGSGPLYARAVHLNNLQGLVWLPWLAVGLELGLRGRGRGWWLVAASVALIVLTGHQHPVLLASLLALAYLLGRRLTGWPGACGLPRALACLVAATALGGLLAAGQLLPMAEMVPHSTRAGGAVPGSRLDASLQPLGCYALLMPQWFGSVFGRFQEELHRLDLALPFEWCPYVGELGLLTVLLAPFLGRRRERWLFLALAWAGLALAMGKALPCYGWLAELPGWSRVRIPGRLLPLWAFGAAMTLGLTLDDLLTGDGLEARARFRLTAVLLLATLGAACVTYSLAQVARGVGEEWWRGALCVAGSALLLLLLARPWRPAVRGLLGAAAVALVVADTTSAFSGYCAYQPASHYRAPDEAATVAGAAPLRCYVPFYCGALAAERHLLFPGVHNAAIYTPLNLRRLANLNDLLLRGAREGDPVGRRWLSLLRVAWTETEPTARQGYGEAHLRPSDLTPAPVAWLAPDWRQVASPEQSLAAVQAPDWEPRRLAVIESSTDVRSGRGDGGAVRLDSVDAQRVVLDVRQTMSSVLVLGQAWAPGWQVWRDGHPRPADAVNHLLLGAQVPGEGLVRFVYNPLTIRLGLWLSLLGCGIMAGWWVVTRHE
jgi:hypothetical protein